MIVHRVWSTTKTKYELHGVAHVTRDWEGWFLFGLIPLYIRNIKTRYERW